MHGFALSALRYHTIAGDSADLDLGQVPQSNRRRVLHGHHDGPQILQAGNTALAANQQHFVAFAQPAGAVVAIVRANGFLQLRDRHAAGCHAHGVGHDFVGPDDTAQSVHIGHAWHGPQRGTDDPVEHAAPFRQRQRLALHGEHIHLSKRGRDRGHATGDAGWQAFVQPPQTLADLLPRPIYVGAILKVDRDIDQAVFGDRTQDLGFRNAQHFHFNRHGNAAFDFFGGHAGRFHDDLDLCTRHVRESVDRQARQGVPAAASNQQGRQQDKQAL